MIDPASQSVSVDIGAVVLGGQGKPFFILGPCVIESEDLVLRVADEVARIGSVHDVAVVFKSSFDKANRTSVTSFRGPGLERGMEILSRAREKTGLPVITDIHTVPQAEMVARTVDMLQIPAFLCRQTDLLTAAAGTGKPVNIKKGQFVAPDDMAHAVGKARSTGNDKILVTERGNSFGYGDLVVDMRSFVRMRRLGCPLIFDATHSAQFPSAGDGCSGGDRSLVPHLARAALGAGADGIFMEVHPDPDNALCDGPNSLALADLEPLIENLIGVFTSVRTTSSVHARAMTEGAVISRSGDTSLEERLKRIKLIIFDVDGILTDGGIVFGSDGMEIKSFHVRDGHGIKIAKRLGLEPAFVTGRSSHAVERRAKDLGIERVFQGMKDKKPALAQLQEELQLTGDEIAVMGDDVVDIPLFRRVGVGISVPEAPSEVRREATYVTRAGGGKGAAREAVELILKARGQWEEALSRYYT